MKIWHPTRTIEVIYDPRSWGLGIEINKMGWLRSWIMFGPVAITWNHI